jgi:DNA-binding transcriptional LysR family regulator
MDDLPETVELLAFVRIVDAGSLSRAAEELGVPRPTLGARLARLEERLGVRLLHRTTRRLVLTAAGEELHRRARGVLAALEEAATAVRPGEGPVAGLLRVSMPPGGGVFGAIILDFMEQHPEVRLEVQFTTEHVDLVGEGYDVAIRAGMKLDPGLVGRTLGRAELIAVASPAYLQRYGRPETAEALASHRCIVGFAFGVRPAARWPLMDGGQVRVDGALACNELELQRQAAERGLGVALLPERLVRDGLATGRLERVLEGVVGGASQIAVVFPERRYLAPVVRAFVDHVVARSAEVLDAGGRMEVV